MALPNLGLSAIQSVLEELYLSENQLMSSILRDNPVLALLPAEETAGGLYQRIQLKHVRPQGRSATFSNALADREASQRVGFNVTWVSNFQVAGVDGDVIDDASGNETILIDHVSTELDGAILTMKDDLAQSAFRNGGGARGRQSGAVATNTITLTDPSEIAHFDVGMEITADLTDGTGVGIVLATANTILSLDRDAGTITFTDTQAG